MTTDRRTLSDEIRERIATASAETRALGEWMIAQLTARAKAAAAARKPQNMRRGGRTKAARSEHMAALARLSHDARAKKVDSDQK